MFSTMTTTPSSIADQIWDILVEECGAVEALREDFLHHFPNFPEFREFRFMGGLGFGGKVWCQDGQYSVRCYREDSTPTREQMIKRANARLEVLA